MKLEKTIKKKCVFCKNIFVVKKHYKFKIYCSSKCNITRWKKANKQKVLDEHRIYRSKNREILRQKNVLYYSKHREERRSYQLKRGRLESVKIAKHLSYMKNREEVIKRSAIWKKNNPQSTRRQGLDLQIAMNNVRRRDKNTCQWYGCGKNYKDITIHVHHIFPKKEYPELILSEDYMICYCKFHHAEWHKARGDNVSQWLIGKKAENIVAITT